MKKTTEKSGTSAVTIFALALIILKLCGKISWSWVWVLAPFWGGLALAIIFFLVGCLVLRKKQH